jgi:glycosyltransferase involved in cell wall biosynthesis
MNLKKDRIRIAILDHSPDLGGAEVSILTFLRHMDRSVHDVTLVLPSRGAFAKALEEVGVPVAVIPLPMELIRLRRGQALHAFLTLLKSFFRLQFFLFHLRSFLKKERFHLVLTNSAKAHLYGSIAARCCAVPLLWRFHDVLSPADFSPLLIRLLSFFGRRLPQKILAVSKVTGEHLARAGVPSEKIEVIFNGIDAERFQGRGDSRSIREELGIGTGTKLVGCIGRLIPQKGQKMLILSAPGVIARYPDTLFLIVGEPFLKEETYRKELLKAIQENGLQGKVFLTGYRKDIGEVLRALDVMVFPSLAPEAFPLSLLEAMALGKPIIASDVGGVREILEDRVTGLLVEPNRPDRITEMVLDLFENRGLSEQIGKKAKERLDREFSLRQYVRGMEQACRRAASKGGP